MQQQSVLCGLTPSVSIHPGLLPSHTNGLPDRGHRGYLPHFNGDDLPFDDCLYEIQDPDLDLTPIFCDKWLTPRAEVLNG